MSKFTLEIETDNAAFHEDGADVADEVARILRQFADRTESYGTMGETVGNLLDYNGNTVGHFEYVED